MNCLQMLHGAYNIQNWQEDDELKQLWSQVSKIILSLGGRYVNQYETLLKVDQLPVKLLVALKI